MEISVSILSILNNPNFAKEVYNLEASGVDYFHIDPMDGKFVVEDNIEEMFSQFSKLKSITMIPIEIHLMTKDLEENIDRFASLEPHTILFHPEGLDSNQITKYLDQIKDYGVKAGLVLKPDTSINSIKKYIDQISILQIMSVEPRKRWARIH